MTSKLRGLQASSLLILGVILMIILLELIWKHLVLEQHLALSQRAPQLGFFWYAWA